MGSGDGNGDASEDGTRRYGTIEGVFVPTLLTILGVILYLRTGWVVGNAGLLGASAVIVVAFAITGATALSLSSVSTNVTPSAGGAYALVARSFGVEVGGAVGVSLYLSQSLVIVLYLFGFRDGWLSIFPTHPPAIIDAVAVVVLVAISLVGARTAFRIQYLILAVVTVSLGAIAVAVVTGPYEGDVGLVGAFPGSPEDGFAGTDARSVFAVFFPATTGIMAGLNMSGELRKPGASILHGTLAAVGVSFVLYLAIAVWLALAVPVEELAGDYLTLAERSAWPPAVRAGLLAATFSSALASLVGAPRILHALAEDRVTPAAGWLGRRSGGGEPRHALLVTIVVVVGGVLLRDLDVAAQVITMVFLLTYGAINAAVLAEILIDLPSYRPTFRVPWPVPVLGAFGCAAAMVAISPLAFAAALVGTIGVLVWVARRDVARPVADIRSALLVKIARWATRTARGMQTSDERTWAPRFLVPIATPHDADRAGRWLPELADPGERIRLVPIGTGDGDEVLDRTSALASELEEADHDVGTPDAAVADDGRGPAVVLAATGDERGTPPGHVVVAGFPPDRDGDRAARRLLRDAFAADVGVVLVPDRRGPPRGLRAEAAEEGSRADASGGDGHGGEAAGDGDGDDAGPAIALWLEEPGAVWTLTDHLPRADLAALVAYRLTRSHRTSLQLVTAAGPRTGADEAEAYLRAVAERARLPGPPELCVVEGSLADAIEGERRSADLHVFALGSQTDFSWWREVQERLDAPCLFVRDSGVENAFA